MKTLIVLSLLLPCLARSVELQGFHLSPADDGRVCRSTIGKRRTTVCFPTAESVAKTQYDTPLPATIDLYKLISSYDAYLTANNDSSTDMSPLATAVVKGAIFLPKDVIHQVAKSYRKLTLSNFAVNGNDALIENIERIEIVGTLDWQDDAGLTGHLNFDAHFIPGKIDGVNSLNADTTDEEAQAIFADMVEVDALSDGYYGRQALASLSARQRHFGIETSTQDSVDLIQQVVAPIFGGTIYLSKAGQLNPQQPPEQTAPRDLTPN